MEKGKDCAQAMWLTLKSLFQFQGQIKRERVGEGGGGVCVVCVCCGLNFFIRPVFFLLLLVSNQSSYFNSIARLLCNLKYSNFSHLEIFLSLLGL